MNPLVTVKRWWRSGNGSNGHDRPLLAKEPEAPPLKQAPPPSDPWLARLDEAQIPRSLTYPTTTLGRILDQSADRFPDAPALFYNDHRWNYRQLLATVNRMAGGLAALGVRRGDRVVMALPNCPEFVFAFFAIQKLGAVVVNAGPLMGKDDLQKILAMTTPRVTIGLDLLAPAMHAAAVGSTVEHFVWVSLQVYQPVLKRLGYQFKLWQGRNGSNAHDEMLDDLLARAPSRPPTIEPDQNAVAVLQPTGGTTGTLKLAMLTHRSLLANAMQVSTWMRAIPGQERTCAVLPMFHVYGLTLCLTSPIFSAGSIVPITRFNAEQMLALLRRHKPTVCPLVPAICDAISDLLEKEQRESDAGKHEPIDGLRLCISGAAPLSRQTAERFKRLTGANVVEGYGLTEASPVTHACMPEQNRAGSIGLPFPDTHVRLVDLEDPTRDVPLGQPGEMWICGPQVMAGYFADPQQTKAALHTEEDGTVWLRTGDVARMDADGFFYILDRRKDMIIRSGMKIYPARVEHVLRMHKHVKDVAVVGRPDAVHSELPVAVVTPKPEPDEEQKLAEELRALCREHLAPYEVPAAVEFLDELPRSALGKLLKRELRKGPTPTQQPCDPTALAMEEDAERVDDDLHEPTKVVVSRVTAPAAPKSEFRGNGNANGHAKALGSNGKT
jgi:long-chain acyl-CoA synthetase